MHKKRNKKIKSLVKKYISELKKQNIDVVSVYIFGSYVKGNYTDWSDIDLAVITKRFIGDGFDFRFLLMKIAKNIDINFEPHPFLLSDLKKRKPFIKEILETGEKIM